MASNPTSAPAGGGPTGASGPGASPSGASGPPPLDTILMMAFDTTPADLTWWATLGAILTGMIVTQILVDTGRYFEHFSGGRNRDPGWMRLGVAVGSTLALGLLMLNCAMAYELIQYAVEGDYASILRFDFMGATSADLLGGIYCLATTSYYAVRAYKMSGRKLWLGVGLGCCNLVTFGLTIAVTVVGYRLPVVTFQTLPAFQEFNLDRIPMMKSWGAVALVTDALICLTMVYYLFRSKDSLFHSEKKLYRKLNTLVIETMFPPVVCLFILNCANDVHSAPVGDFRRTVRAILPPFYYLSLVHSLVARTTVQSLLDAKLASDGIERGTFGGTATGSRTYVSHGPGYGNKIGIKSVEEGEAEGLENDGNVALIHLNKHARRASIDSGIQFSPSTTMSVNGRGGGGTTRRPTVVRVTTVVESDKRDSYIAPRARQNGEDSDSIDRIELHPAQR